MLNCIRRLLIALLALAATVVGAQAIEAPPPPGFTLDTSTIDIAGNPERVDIFRPAQDPPVGAAIVAHGFARSRDRHRDLGRALAEAGIVAVIPDLPNVMNLWGNGDAIVDLIEKVETGTLGMPAFERSRIVLIGTSAGGLASVLAAARSPGIAGWIGLDPVDRTGTGAAAAAKLTSPAWVLLGGASSCNLFGSGRTIARAVPAALVHTESFKAASHCDFEGPTNNLCSALCGKASAGMQERVRFETVRAAMLMLSAGAPSGGAPVAGPVDDTAE